MTCFSTVLLEAHTLIYLVRMKFAACQTHDVFCLSQMIFVVAPTRFRQTNAKTKNETKMHATKQQSKPNNGLDTDNEDNDRSTSHTLTLHTPSILIDRKADIHTFTNTGAYITTYHLRTHTTRAAKMCVHSLYIFTTCGHFLLAPRPILPCSSISTSFPTNSRRSGVVRAPQCNGPQGHPYTSRFLDRRCASCARRLAQEGQDRSQRLQEVRTMFTKGIVVDESRWRIAFGETTKTAKGWDRVRHEAVSKDGGRDGKPKRKSSARGRNSE